ncbi:MAG TPA: hypothetical protein VGQ92_19380 [Actinoplanes sp.]|jgi:hypothetical protein|nr:hypothetical protein [Actinoplanes sp.]
MPEDLRPDEAARALTEIRQRQEQVIKLANIPAWYWWAIAGLMVGFSAAIDSHRPLAIAIGTSLFVIGVLTATARVVIGGMRRTQLRNDLLGPIGVLAILGFVATVLAVSLPTAFALQAAGVRYPATLGVLVGAILMVLSGPWLTRFLQRIMLAKRAGSQR